MQLEVWKFYKGRLKNTMQQQILTNVHYLGSSENEAWKNSGLYGIWTYDLCDTGAALYQLS